jgi:hypothetical protein
MRQNDESAETRAERYEALYKEQRITQQEYELLCDEFLQQIADPKPDNHSTNSGQLSQDQVKMDIREWMTEDHVDDLIYHYRALIPETEPGPYDEDKTEDYLQYHIPALPSEISSACHANFYSPPLQHMLYFSAKEQEERFREVLEMEEQYQILDDSTDGKPPWMWFAFNVAPSEYLTEITDEDILREINHFFRVISHTFEVTISDLASTDISWEWN